MSIYERFNVPTVINACGSVTRLGGARMPADVLDAFVGAAGEAVSLEELQGAASRSIAKWTTAEAGLVTSGAAAALTLGAAAIICRDNLARIERLPECRGCRHHFVVARDHRSGYDHAVRATGARLTEVGFNEIVSGAGVRSTEVWEYEAAFNERTAGVLYVMRSDARPHLREVAAAAHRAMLPVIVDAAGELPPRSNLHQFIDDGADLVAFSGGKAVRGPQSTGILCGRRELIESAAMQMLDMDDHYELWEPPATFIDKTRWPALPRHGIGRAMKVSKEEIVALLVALEQFESGAYDQSLPQMRQDLEIIANTLADSPVTTVLEEARQGRPPTLTVQLSGDRSRDTAFDICRALRAGHPKVFVGHGQLERGRIVVNPMCFDEGQAELLASRLREEVNNRAKR